MKTPEESFKELINLPNSSDDYTAISKILEEVDKCRLTEFRNLVTHKSDWDVGVDFVDNDKMKVTLFTHAVREAFHQYVTTPPVDRCKK